MQATGMSVDQGMVRIEILGLSGGIGRTAVLHKGETLSYEDLRIRFDDFDLSEFDPEAGKIDFGVVFIVEHEGHSMEVVPTFKGGMDDEPTRIPAAVPGTGGITLSVGRIDAEGGSVQLQVYDPSLPAQGPTPASLVIDLSTKPLIVLVWLGTILVVVGICAAMALRRRDIASIPVSE
jgi:cytochrome c-type biogenesis protein CcmF